MRQLQRVISASEQRKPSAADHCTESRSNQGTLKIISHGYPQGVSCSTVDTPPDPMWMGLPDRRSWGQTPLEFSSSHLPPWSGILGCVSVQIRCRKCEAYKEPLEFLLRDNGRLMHQCAECYWKWFPYGNASKRKHLRMFEEREKRYPRTTENRSGSSPINPGVKRRVRNPH